MLPVPQDDSPINDRRYKLRQVLWILLPKIADLTYDPASPSALNALDER